MTAVFAGEDAWRVLSGGKGAPGFLNSASFMPAHAHELQFLEQAFLRLRGGEADIPRLRADITRITGDPAFPIRNVREAQRRVERSTRVEADALTLFAAAVIAAAAVLLGQALIRLVAAAIGEGRTLRALGMSRPQLIAAMAAPGLVVALVGGVGAVVIAVAASSRVPLGLADSFDLHPGTRFDAAVLVPGALVIVAAVVLVSLSAGVFAVRRPRATASRGRGRLVGAVAALPLPPSLTLGVRMALERPGPMRVGPGLLGAVVAVLAVVAAITVRHGVDDTLTHPERAGQVWDLAYYPGAPERVIARDKDVAGAAHLDRGSAELDAIAVPVYGIRPVGRPLRMVVLDGRAPAAADEIALGPSTASLLHVGVGDAVRPGSGKTRSLRVVGTALLWEEGGHTAYDEGGWLTDAGFRALAPPEIVEERTFVDVRQGANVEQVNHRLAAAGALVEGGWPAPAGVSNLHTTRQVPALLGALLALLGAGAVGHGLVMTLRRRRRDVAVLRALGMSRREVRAMLVWQATTVAFVGLALGIPLGILVGHMTWRWLAASMPLEYVAPGIVVAVGLVIPAALLLVNAVATWPARTAARLRPATALRAD